MLDKFRETAITWDKANRKVYEPLRVSAGDNKGRKLSVQVVNGGVIEDLSGASLSLFWETKDKAHKGLDAFSAVDATKGEFEIYYTTGMLSNEGILNANLVLVDTSGRVVSEPFTITVFKGINDDAIQSSDSFTALTQALAQVGNINNKAERAELLELESTFEQTKVSLEQQLAQTGNEVSTKIDRGDVSVSDIDKNKGLLDETFFTEEVKQQWAGTTPINGIPADDSITNKKLVKKAVRKENTSFVSVSTNQFDKNDVINGYSIDPSTGELVANSQYAVTIKKIPVIAGEPVVFSKSNERSARYAFYNGKTFISSDTVARTETHKTVVPPAGANGALYAVQSADLAVAQIVQGNVLLPYQPYIAPRLMDISPAIEKDSVKIVYQNGSLYQVHEGDKTTTLQYENGVITGYTETTILESVQTNLIYEGNNLKTVEREVI